MLRSHDSQPRPPLARCSLRISENVGLLTNPEVMALLEPLGAAADAPPATVRALPIERTVHAYLKGQGCQPASKQQIDAFAAAVQPFNLMRAELLQLVNLRPTQVRAFGTW